MGCRIGEPIGVIQFAHQPVASEVGHVDSQLVSSGPQGIGGVDDEGRFPEQPQVDSVEPNAGHRIDGAEA